MKGLIYYEWLLFRKKAGIMAAFAVMTTVLGILVFLLLLKAPDSGTVYVDGDAADEGIRMQLTKAKIEIVPAMDQAQVHMKITQDGHQQVVELNNIGNSKEQSVGTKTKITNALQEYSNSIANDRIKGLNLEEGFLQPIVLKDTNQQETKQKTTLNQVLQFAIAIFPLMLTITLDKGLIDERKVQSIYGVLYSGVPRWKILLIIMFFRVVMATSLMYILFTVGLSIYLKDFLLAAAYMFPILLAVVFSYYMVLVLSTWLRNPTTLNIFSFIVGFGLAGGFALSFGGGWVQYFPVWYGAILAKQSIFGNASWSSAMQYCLISIAYYGAALALLTFLGQYLMKKERILTAD